MFKNYTKILRTPKVAAAFALFAFGAANSQVATFPWTETFEDTSPTRELWTQIYEVNNMSWTFATAPSTGGSGVTAYQGSKMANYPATSHNFDKTKLVSPVLDLSNMATATLSFHYRNPLWNPDQNWLRIFYRTSAESPWVQISEFHSNVGAWTSSGNIDLPTPSATYQIAVECETDYGYSTTVDALVIETTSLSVAEKNTLTARFYPNPASDRVFFSANDEIETIAIYNQLGQKVSVQNLGLNHGSIDVSQLAPGYYILKADSQKGTFSYKLIKN